MVMHGVGLLVLAERAVVDGERARLSGTIEGTKGSTPYCKTSDHCRKCSSATSLEEPTSDSEEEIEEMRGEISFGKRRNGNEASQ